MITIKAQIIILDFSRENRWNKCLLNYLGKNMIPSTVNDAGLMSSVVVTGLSTGIDLGTFIRHEWRAPGIGSIPNRDDIDPVLSICEPYVSPSPSSPLSIAKAPRDKTVCELIAEGTCRVLLMEALDLIQKSTSITMLPLLSILHYGNIKGQQFFTERFHLLNYVVILWFER